MINLFELFLLPFPPNLVIMSNRIAVVLKEKNLKQIDLASKLNVAKSTVSMWCSNASQPSIVKLVLISDYLGCDLTDLLVSNKKTKKTKSIRQ
jgi:transcriptional regulator with XRE-family HTH domain